MDYRVARIIRWLIYILVGLLVILLLFVAYRGIMNAFKESSTSTTPTQAVNLNDYKTNGAQLKFITDGPIVASENHYQYVITISATQRTVDVIKGYGQAPVTSKSFGNNQASYDAFIAAVNSAGFANTKTAPSGATLEGQCSLGDKYSYQIVSGGSMPLNSWNTSCDTGGGTFNGRTSLTQELFQTQIPNDYDIVGSVQ